MIGRVGGFYFLFFIFFVGWENKKNNKKKGYGVKNYLYFILFIYIYIKETGIFFHFFFLFKILEELNMVGWFGMCVCIYIYV